jgi:hypothetical protein
MRAGWILGIRCGNENIIASGRTLADAESAAINREIELKLHYVLDLPPCRRVVSVDPQGAIVAASRRIRGSDVDSSSAIRPAIASQK